MTPAIPLLKGTLDVLVLQALRFGPQHGFEIATWLEQRSAGALSIDDSALYQALHRLEERALIRADWGVTENNRRARYYELTPQGRTHLRAEATALTRYAKALTTILAERPA